MPFEIWFACIGAHTPPFLCKPNANQMQTNSSTRRRREAAARNKSGGCLSTVDAVRGETGGLKQAICPPDFIVQHISSRARTCESLARRSIP